MLPPRLQHDDADAGCRQVQGGRQSGEAAADHRNINIALTIERQCGGRWRRCANIDIRRASPIGQRLIHGAKMRLVAAMRNRTLLSAA
jgi:hypothetical protein